MYVKVEKNLWGRADLILKPSRVLSTFEFWLELAWVGAKCKGKTLLVIEIIFTLHRYCTVQYRCSLLSIQFKIRYTVTQWWLPPYVWLSNVLPLHFAPSQASSSQNLNVDSYLQYFEVDSLKVKVTGSNTGYLINFFLLYYNQTSFINSTTELILRNYSILFI